MLIPISHHSDSDSASESNDTSVRQSRANDDISGDRIGNCDGDADGLTFLTTPPINSIASAYSIKSVILSNYHFQSTIDVVFLISRCNDVYRVRCENDQATFYARLNRHRNPYAGNDAYRTALLRHASQNGAPVSGAVMTRRGTSIVDVLAPEGVREFSLYKAIPGTVLPYLAFPRESGIALARFHLACTHFEGPASVRIMDTDTLIDSVRSNISSTPYLTPHFKQQFVETVGTLEQTFRSFKKLSIGHCHCDVAGNRLATTRPDGTVDIALIDFDMVCPGFLAYDLAKLFYKYHVTAGSGDIKLAEKAWKLALTGYSEIKPLDKDDISAVPILAALYALRILNRRIYKIPFEGVAAVEDNPEQWLQRAKQFEAMRDATFHSA